MEAHGVFADAANSQALKVVLSGQPVEPLRPTVESPEVARS